ncbi:MAG TPA: DUF2975 domain-containing protein [Candidatus Dorea intestinavium]|nr:DUF2975 domain-containing protein [Candidatus Dorea intestinavium]
MKEEKYNPNYLGIAKFLFLLITIAIMAATIIQFINLVWAIITPYSSMSIVNTGYSYKMDELAGHLNLSFSFLGIIDDPLISNARVFSISFGITYLLLRSFPQIIMLLIGYKTIKNLTKTYTPFTKKVIKLLRSLAWVMIGFGLFSQLIMQIIVTLINFHTMPNTDLVAMIEWGYVMSGVLILVISETYQKGYDLQEEVDTLL